MAQSRIPVSIIKRSFYWASAFFGMFLVLSLVFADWNGNMANKTAGDQLDSTAWNAMVENVNFLKSRITSVSCGSGKFVSGFDASGQIICTDVFNSIVADGAGRKWSDNTYAKSCNEYRRPSANYAYRGLTGNGTYTIKPGGTAFNVYCDMVGDDGGWTLIVGINGADRAHNTASAVTPANIASLAGKGKFSDADINSIRSAVGSEGVVRLDCNGSVDYFDYRAAAWSAAYSGYPNGTGWNVYTQPWGTAPHSGGGSAYPNEPGPWAYSAWGNNTIYGYSGWTGCYSGAGTSFNGTVWIR